MKRLLKLTIYFAVIVAIIFLVVPIYDTSESVDLDQNIEDTRLAGANPRDKMAQLVGVLHGMYPEAAISGRYELRPRRGTNEQTNIVRYDVQLKFDRPNTVPEFNDFEDRRQRLIGELAISTVRLLSFNSLDPSIGENSLNEMHIFVYTTTFKELTTEDLHPPNPNDRERQIGGFVNTELFLQPSAEKVAYMFDSEDIKGLLKEKDVYKWSQYATPLPLIPSLPNTGPIN